MSPSAMEKDWTVCKEMGQPHWLISAVQLAKLLRHHAHVPSPAGPKPMAAACFERALAPLPLPFPAGEFHKCQEVHQPQLRQRHPRRKHQRDSGAQRRGSASFRYPNDVLFGDVFQLGAPAKNSVCPRSPHDLTSLRPIGLPPRFSWSWHAASSNT